MDDSLYGNRDESSSAELVAILARLEKLDDKFRKMRRRWKKAQKEKKGKNQQPSMLRDTFIASIPSAIELAAAVIRKK